VQFRSVARIVLILLPLATTAARLHGHHVDAPDLATQEVNRCLNLIKIAASKRGDERGMKRQECRRAYGGGELSDASGTEQERPESAEEPVAPGQAGRPGSSARFGNSRATGDAAWVLPVEPLLHVHAAPGL